LHLFLKKTVKMATPDQGRKWSVSGLLVALGIVFGDIGTSPLYVFQAIVGSEKVTKELIMGSLSCIFWTLILITTFKYVYLALKADNRGEGGIFALYARVRRYKARWAIFPALIGCATLMSDGFITPAISISAAVEGIHRISTAIPTVPIVIGILLFLFISQQFRAGALGAIFGPIMFLWFALIGGLGLSMLAIDPSVLEAINPYYAFQLITHYKGDVSGSSGFWLLGAVFLCTTGCEALYSDLGRCGKISIRLTWAFVFPCLILCYFGQGAWLLRFEGQSLPENVQKVGVFYSMLPQNWVIPVIGLAIVATVIVSQALINGIFTMVSEAIRLKLWFNMRISYPSQARGQVYIPFINWFLMVGCIAAVVVFRHSSDMEAAYGLAIVIDMVMTSSLLLHFIHMRNQSYRRAIVLGCVFGFVELAFLVASINKIPHGGWFSLFNAFFIFGCVFIFYKARKIRDKHTEFQPSQEYIPILKDLIQDETVDKTATNLVFLSMSPDEDKLDSNIIYSLFKKKPKRADIYWFVHVVITDSPYAKKYKVHTIVPGKVFYVRLKFGFKIEHKVNLMFKEIVQKMQDNGEVDEKSHYPSLRKYDIPADFKFITLNSRLSVDDEITPFEQFTVRAYRVLKNVSIPPAEEFGLDMSNVKTETVPIYIRKAKDIEMERQY
jgi:KUP system potassium uptake protein